LNKPLLGAEGQFISEEEKLVRIASLPKHVDWREKGVVTAVKDQGMCGSCWTFAATSAIESHYAIATGEVEDLSEQQILDCTPNPKHCGGTGGCQGGTAQLAFDQIRRQGGLSTEWTYPYRSYFGDDFDNCGFNASRTKPVATVKDYVNLPSNDYLSLMEALAFKGPVVVSVDATNFRDYEEGVFDGCNMEDPVINHAVVAVGYGTDDEHGDYFIVRNSWGPKYGLRGYIHVKRDGEATCGVDKEPLDGSGCEGGPEAVKVCGMCGILYDNSYPMIEA